MRKTITWVLVADGKRARVYKSEGPGKGLTPALDREYIAVLEPTRKMVSDRQGRAFDSHGVGRHAIEPHTDPQRYEKLRFARQLAAELEGYKQKGAFDRLVIAAAPKTLGDLRGELSPAVQAAVLGAVAKDLTKVPMHDLGGHLKDVLPV